jgi:glycerol-3-phosphate dehydrogenase
VASLMAGVLGWDAPRIEAEVEATRRRVAAELRAEQLSDDASAHAAIADTG